jgi:isopentenyl phosphate kinase
MIMAMKEGLVLEDARAGAHEKSKIYSMEFAPFVQYEIPAVSIQPSSFVVFKDESNIIFDLTAIKEFLKRNHVPVIHGDIVIDCKGDYRILSGDHIMPYLAKNMKIDLCLHASNVDGVLDDKGRTIEKIDENNIGNILKNLKGSEGIDVTGGMYLKVLETYKIGTKTIIFNGKKDNSIFNALIGKFESVKGTLIVGKNH